MIQIEVQSNEMKIALDKMIDKLQDKKLFFKKLGQRIIADAVYRHFEEKTDPEGKKWPSVSQKYAERKQKKYPGEPTHNYNPSDLLVFSQTLYNSITSEYTESFVKIFVDGEAEKYAGSHNFGLHGQKKRQFLGIGELEKSIALETQKEFLESIVR
ncbi:MAG: hypothetical protein HPY78_03395 [Brevinematales bacterium]|nr:hypothetical protein [Brevinematales bacterium]